MLAQTATLQIVLDVDLILPSHFRLCGPCPWKMSVHAAAAGRTTTAGQGRSCTFLCELIMYARAYWQALWLISYQKRLASLIVYVGLHKPLLC